MARITVDDIQSRIAAIVDQDEITTNITSTDYSLRLKYINMALAEWGETYDWQVLFREYNTQTSTSTGNTSITLPTNFRKLASYPLITYDGVTAKEFPEALPQEGGRFSDTDLRIEIHGDMMNRYTMRVLGTNLVSGASIKVPFYASPQSVASPANVPEIPNPEFLVKRTIAYIWEAREDSRFPLLKQEAEKLLRNMIEYDNVFSEASTFDRVRTVEQNRYGFRLGRD